MNPEQVTVTLPRKVVVMLLAQVMSDLSERAYCANWMSGLEEAVPRLCAEFAATGCAEYGQSELQAYEATTITAFVEALGGWDVAMAEVDA